MVDLDKGLDYPPSRFTNVCKYFNSLLYPDLEIKAGADEKERKKLQRRQKEKFREAQGKFEKIQRGHDAKGQQYKREERRFLKAQEDFNRSTTNLRDAKLKRALSLGALDLEPYEVRSFSNNVFIVLLLLLITVSFAVVFLTDFDLFYIILSIVITALGPGLLSIYIDSYPYVRARRMRALTVGRMPEAIHHMSLSMRLTPSLDRAVKYASSSLSEPLASNLRKVLWDVYMREYSSVEEAFIAFAYDWSDWDEDFKRSLYMVRSAALEKTQEGINRVLDKANQIIIDGTKSKLEEFSNSLSIPAMVLFAIGIMLPLLLVIILPIFGIGDEWTWHTLSVINIVLPLGIMSYTYHILGKRPEMTSPPEIESTLSTDKKFLIVFICLLSSAGFMAMAFIVKDSIFSSLFVVWGVGIPLILYGFLTNMDAKKKGREVRKVEDEFPEALFQLGNRIAEGKPFETALLKTANTMKNTLISNLFGKISYNLQVTRASLKEVLFGSSGLLVDSPARTINNTMRTVVEASSKDPRTAGKTIMLISNYLSDLKNVEKEMKERLGEITGMMTQTVIFIAPVVLGVTIILYQLLSVNLGEYEIPREMDVELYGLGQDTISPGIMAISLGIYLLELVIIVAYFISRIEFGRDGIELKNTISVYLLISLISFSVGLIVTFLIGSAYITNL